MCYNKKEKVKKEGPATRRSSHFEKRRCDLGPFSPRNTESVARRLAVEEEVATRSSCASRARFRFELERV